MPPMDSSSARPLAALTGAVMIVDEVPYSRGEMNRNLREAGVASIVEVEDSVTAMQILRNSDQDWALIICDLDVGGLRMVRTLRQDASTPEAHRKVPFIMLTDDTTLAIVTDIREAGANGVVAKPFNPAKLITTTLNVMAARRK
ncbi:MAG TPA: response regulator [Rhodospirillaceae bacterium]|nr:response regulator [Rhodospirillaceae bacterium]